MDTITSLISQWGSAVGLGIFALWALWMLRSTLPKAAASTPPAASSPEDAIGPLPARITAPNGVRGERWTAA